MNITTYFIKYPVVAIVLNTIIALIGFLAFEALSLREYPEVHLPKIEITTYYPNASAQLVEEAITKPIEDTLAKIDNIENIESYSNNNSSNISITFKDNVSIDQALMATRENLGAVQLPHNVKAPIISRNSNVNNMPFVFVAIDNPLMTPLELTHYANLNLKDVFRAIPGVAAAGVSGESYMYEITLDTVAMHNLKTDASEVFEALALSKIELPAGNFQDKFSITFKAELQTIEDYENLIIKKHNNSQIKLKDVADIHLTTDTKASRVHFNGNKAICLEIEKVNDANPLVVSQLIKQQLASIKQNLPKEFELNIILDKAQHIEHSLQNVRSTIVEATIFVLIIIIVFLRNIRAMLIPLITIPISLGGAFIFLQIFGFSINTMTLLAMVLAIGLIVDDAIVVLENIQHRLDNENISKQEIVIEATKEISFAVLAMTFTLASVYAPLFFIKGVVGKIFMEFAATLAGSVLISGIVALTLSPIMSEKFLQKKEINVSSKIDLYLDNLTDFYQKTLTIFLNYRKISLLIFGMSLGAIVLLLKIIPNEIVPKEDRSLIGIYVPPIDNNIDLLEENVSKIEAKLTDLDEVKFRLSYIGDWGAYIFMPLKEQRIRKKSSDDLVQNLQASIKLPLTDLYVQSDSSSLPGLERRQNQGELSIIVSASASYLEIYNNINKAVENLNKDLIFKNTYHDLSLDSASYHLNIDENALAILGLSHKQVAKIVEISFGGNRGLEFVKDGIIYNVNLKLNDAAWHLSELYAVNRHNMPISLAAVAELKLKSGARSLYHYNQKRAAIISTNIPKGKNLNDQAIKLEQELDKLLPSNYRKDITGSIKTLKETNKTSVILFALSLVFIYAILTVQFNNFVDPFIILLTVPLAISGALAFLWLFNSSINIYSQIGLVTLIGLITKHGILIVDFANKLGHQSNIQAIITAASRRLRPILMTTLAMLFGALPLIISKNAGYEARKAIGVVIVGGLGIGTLFTLYILPSFYLMINEIKKRY